MSKDNFDYSELIGHLFSEIPEVQDNDESIKRLQEELKRTESGSRLIKEESNSPSYIQDLGDQMSQYHKVTRQDQMSKLYEVPEKDPIEVRFENYEKQLTDLRRGLNEATVVSGIGQGGDGQLPGGGEVNFQYLDDVYGKNEAFEWNAGSVPVWDGVQLVPSGGGTGPGYGPQTPGPEAPPLNITLTIPELEDVDDNTDINVTKSQVLTWNGTQWHNEYTKTHKWIETQVNHGFYRDIVGVYYDGTRWVEADPANKDTLAEAIAYAIDNDTFWIFTSGYFDEFSTIYPEGTVLYLSDVFGVGQPTPPAGKWVQPLVKVVDGGFLTIVSPSDTNDTIPPGPQGVQFLGDLDDVLDDVTQTASDGDVLAFDGTQWYASAVDEIPGVQGIISDWEPATNYLEGNYVRNTVHSAIYYCNITHTSSNDFDADLGAGRWDPLRGYLSTLAPSQGASVPQTIQTSVLYQDLGAQRIPTDDDELIPKWFMEDYVNSSRSDNLLFYGGFDANNGVYSWPTSISGATAGDTLPTNPSAGVYLIITVAGNAPINNLTVGDWIIWDGTQWRALNVGGGSGPYVIGAQNISTPPPGETSEGLFLRDNNSILEFKSIIAQNNSGISLASNATDIYLNNTGLLSIGSETTVPAGALRIWQTANNNGEGTFRHVKGSNGVQASFNTSSQVIEFSAVSSASTQSLVFWGVNDTQTLANDTNRLFGLSDRRIFNTNLAQWNVTSGGLLLNSSAEYLFQISTQMASEQQRRQFNVALGGGVYEAYGQSVSPLTDPNQGATLTGIADMSTTIGGSTFYPCYFRNVSGAGSLRATSILIYQIG